jgi:hypothetical protein
MRVLVADRNARLLESISLTFAGQFEIHTASTRRGCAHSLQQNEFDLVIVSDRLTDGPGLPLLGEIARSSPDTLRVFAAKRPRLQFLKGKLGPFGLFRTLTYPIDPRGLLSTLTLARAGLQVAASAPETQIRPLDVSASTPATQTGSPNASASAPGIQLRAPDRSAATSPPVSPRDAPQPRKDRSQPHRAPDPRSVALVLARLQPPLLVPPRPQLPTKRSAPSQTAAIPRTIVRPTLPAPLPSQVPPEKLSQNGSLQRESTKRAAPPPGTATGRAIARAYRPTRNAPRPEARPKRTKVFAGAALVAAVVATIAIFRPFDGDARPSSTEATLAANAKGSPSPAPAPGPQIERPAAPVLESTPFVPKPSDDRARYLPQPRAENASPAPFDEGAALSQTAAVSTPIADPSTFGSEAAEPIYSN